MTVETRSTALSAINTWRARSRMRAECVWSGCGRRRGGRKVGRPGKIVGRTRGLAAVAAGSAAMTWRSTIRSAAVYKCFSNAAAAPAARARPTGEPSAAGTVSDDTRERAARNPQRSESWQPLKDCVTADISPTVAAAIAAI